MEMNEKHLFSSIILVVILCFNVGYYVSPELLTHTPPKLTANVYVLIETAEGKTEYQIGNLITDIGEKYPRNILGFDNVTNHNATKWITLSNDASPAVTWTKLPNELTANGFQRSLGTVVAWTYSGDVAYNVSKKFTATSDGLQVQCAGLQWNGKSNSDNNLFAAAAFTQTTFNTNDNCTIRWTIVYNAN